MAMYLTCNLLNERIYFLKAIISRITLEIKLHSEIHPYRLDNTQLITIKVENH